MVADAHYRGAFKRSLLIGVVPSDRNAKEKKWKYTTEREARALLQISRLETVNTSDLMEVQIEMQRASSYFRD